MFFFRQQLKARIAMQQEQSENSALDFAEQALSGEQLVSPNDLFTFIEGITTADVTNVSGTLRDISKNCILNIYLYGDFFKAKKTQIN